MMRHVAQLTRVRTQALPRNSVHSLFARSFISSSLRYNATVQAEAPTLNAATEATAAAKRQSNSPNESISPDSASLSYTLSKSSTSSLNISSNYLSQLSQVANPTPRSALSAFAYRLLLAMEETEQSPLLDNLPLIEKCLIDASFWRQARELSKTSLPKIPQEQWDHVRQATVTSPSSNPNAKSQTNKQLELKFNQLYINYRNKKLAFTQFNDAKHGDNRALAALGESLINGLTVELIAQKFPHLPTRFIEESKQLFVGDRPLAAVADLWGIAPEQYRFRSAQVVPTVKPTDCDYRMTRVDKSFGHLIGGSGVSVAQKGHPKPSLNASRSQGLLRWSPDNFSIESVKTPALASRQSVTMNPQFRKLEAALATSVRALTGAVLETSGFETARAFVYGHLLSRLTASASSTRSPPLALADISLLIKFDDPMAVLNDTCIKYGMEPPHTRLLQETGRLSNHPVYIQGVYSGQIKLGEGVGDSKKMSAFRAAENALRRLFLSTATSYAETQPGVEPPSAQWANKRWAPLPITDSAAPRESKNSHVGKAMFIDDL